MKIDRLQIFSINNNNNSHIINKIGTKGYDLVYFDMNSKLFINQILNSNHNFLDYNNNSLYILRGGNFLDIKNLFALIEGYPANVGRGGSQKSHALSPLDLRLSSYILALFNFDYKLVSSLNSFNIMSKDRYLSYTDKYNNKSVTIDNKYSKPNKSVTKNQYFKPYKSVIINNYSDIKFKPITISKMPLYCQNNDSGQY